MCGSRGVAPWELRLACALVCGLLCAPSSSVLGQTQTKAPPQSVAGPLYQWNGRLVQSISFEGVSADRLDPLSGHLAQSVGKPLNPDDLRESLRQLYSTGLYETIQVAGTEAALSPNQTVPGQAAINLIFSGVPRTFIGTVGVYGAKGPTLNTQLQRASQLQSGTRFLQAKLTNALQQMRQTMAQNGFYEPESLPPSRRTQTISSSTLPSRRSLGSKPASARLRSPATRE